MQQDAFDVLNSCTGKNINCMWIFVNIRNVYDVPYASLWCVSTSDGSHSLQLYFSWHKCPSPLYPFISNFFPDVEIFEVFCDKITPVKLRTANLLFLAKLLYPFSGGGQTR